MMRFAQTTLDSRLRGNDKKGGFTLLEMLVAMAIASALLWMLAQTFGAFQSHLSFNQSGMQTETHIRSALLELQNEFSCAVVRTNTDRPLAFTASTNASGVSIFFSVPERSHRTNFLRHFGYRWDGLHLYRVEFDSIEDENNWSTAGQLAWIPDVSAFSAVFFTEDGSARTNQWTDTNSLPFRAELNLSIQENGAPQPRVFQLPVYFIHHGGYE